MHSMQKTSFADEPMSDDEEYVDLEQGAHPSTHRAGARGTILVTLRNVPPYTEWCVILFPPPFTC